jgi:hypothetical protein
LTTNVIALLAVALGGGIVAALLGSWFDRLSALEVARLVVQAELMANLAAHHAFAAIGPDDEAPHVQYSTSAWLTHRDRLAIRAQRFPDVWQALTNFYALVLALPYDSSPLDESSEAQASYAVANLDVLEPSTFELVPVYGPRRAWAIWRERRLARAAHAKELAAD